MPSNSERLTRVETRIEHLIELAEQNRAELQEHLTLMRTWREETHARLAETGKLVDTLSTHLAWMKGIWAAAQASIVGWLGLK